MKDIPNKNNINVNTEMMPFKKFVESLGILYREETIKIVGCFKEKGTDNIINNDIFEAKRIGKGKDLELIYKTYLKWFNRTRINNELEREFISVKKAETP